MSISDKDLQTMLATATEAARRAGRHAMQQIRNVTASVKSPDQLVTQADIACQKIIIDRIKETYPDHGFIAEEGENGDIFKQSPRGRDDLWWVIDPIDGTNNFAKGMLLFVVHIAVMHEGCPIVGVIFDPATESMFTAVKGGDSQLNGRKITAGNDAVNVFSSIGTDSHFENGVPSWIPNLMQKCRFRTLGSTSLQMAYVAKGGLIAGIFLSPKLWDVAAGAILCQSADALVTNWDGKPLFPVDTDAYQGETIKTFCANKKVHGEILQLLK